MHSTSCQLPQKIYQKFTRHVTGVILYRMRGQKTFMYSTLFIFSLLGLSRRVCVFSLELLVQLKRLANHQDRSLLLLCWKRQQTENCSVQYQPLSRKNTRFCVLAYQTPSTNALCLPFRHQAREADFRDYFYFLEKWK